MRRRQAVDRQRQLVAMGADRGHAAPHIDGPSLGQRDGQPGDPPWGLAGAPAQRRERDEDRLFRGSTYHEAGTRLLYDEDPGEQLRTHGHHRAGSEAAKRTRRLPGTACATCVRRTTQVAMSLSGPRDGEPDLHHDRSARPDPHHDRIPTTTGHLDRPT